MVFLVDELHEADVGGLLHGAPQVGLSHGVRILHEVFAFAHLVVVTTALGAVYRVVERVSRLVDQGHERNQFEGGARFAAHRDGVVHVVAYGAAVACKVGDGAYLARLHLHDDGCAAGGVLVEYLFSQLGFHDVLHIHVDGGDQVVAVDGFHVLFRYHGYPDVPHQTDTEVPSVAARKELVERRFEAELARFAQGTCREGPVGFVPLGILGVDEAAAQASFIEDGESLDAVELELVHLVAYQPLVLAARAAAQGFCTDFAQPAQEMVFRVAGNGAVEAVGQGGTEGIELLGIHVEYGEVHRQVVGGGVGGENPAVVRIDVAARGGHIDGLVALAVGAVAQGGAVGTVLGDEDHGEDGDRDHGEDGIEHPHARHDAALDVLLARSGRIVSVMGAWHG